ncbi:isocitrate lyase/phosphoenolpyruvate mutase family protein [uncultured Phascolarctobacterium sp.]|uniref:isocitrate lyase/PEP mutase family protein n=1 Tax=uncultured Phascolarctobacterium sp. TaxID=512296 RepID=UPI0027D9ABD8|nr:isocitrate lyase/phosphoenolpyruvate mutase family protein [uncultured Phascolarctobacterium sp.]
MNKQRKRLQELLQKPDILVLPGVYDALTAKIAAEVGFEALVMGGYSIAASRLGQPDVGYLSMTEMTQALKGIVDATELPVFADGDTGYGNALSVRRTMQEYERAGAAAVLFEDQVWPKRCGHMAGKQVIEAAEHARKLRAAADARTDSDFLLIARTDARAVNGLDDAIERGKLYLANGAEALFIEAPQNIGELETIARAFPDTVLIANMIEGGRTPNLTAKDLENIGFKIVFWPCSALYVITQAFKEALTVLHETGTTKGYEDKMMHFSDFNRFIGLESYMELEKRYK